jgi:hypothetical protein
VRFAALNEIEYLNSLDAPGRQDIDLVREMSRRLDALRRYDQNYSEADWCPHAGSGGRAAWNARRDQ